ncbi:MAG: fasciclin domain-containing protein [Mycobacterium sp.]
MADIQRKALTAASIAAIAVTGLSGCKAEIKPIDSGSATTTVTVTTSVVTQSAAPTTATGTATPEGSPAGPGCASYEQQVPTGPGSIAGMAKDSVEIAVSNNPELTMLTQALSGKLNAQVNLLDTLKKGEYTLFAPTDAAFGKLDPATTNRLKTDASFLNGILTYHLVNGQLTLAQVDGIHQTLDNPQTVTVSGTSDDLKVNAADVTCGGISTANAQVYMIDTVLMPPA